MSSKTIGLSVAIITLSGGFGLATIDKAAAEAATGKCAIEWKQAKANGTTNGKTWKEFFDQCGADQNGLSRSISLTPADPKPADAVATPAAAAAATAATAAARSSSTFQNSIHDLPKSGPTSLTPNNSSPASNASRLPSRSSTLMQSGLLSMILR